MTDRDRQMQGGGHSSYGEAVGVVLRSRMAATPRLSSFADDQFRLSGQYFRWTMAAPMQRSGSENLTQYARRSRQEERDPNRDEPDRRQGDRDSELANVEWLALGAVGSRCDRGARCDPKRRHD